MALFLPICVSGNFPFFLNNILIPRPTKARPKRMATMMKMVNSIILLLVVYTKLLYKKKGLNITSGKKKLKIVLFLRIFLHLKRERRQSVVVTGNNPEKKLSSINISEY